MSLGEKKLDKLITPDVARQQLYKTPKTALDAKEEVKESKKGEGIGGISSKVKISEKTILFNSKVDEPSIIGSD